MAIAEIDSLLTRSIKCIRNSELEKDVKKHIIWSLENLPETYDFDAGGFDKSELDGQFDYRTIDPFELGLFVSDEAKESEDKGLIYDWSAFLLNNNCEHFSKIDNEQKIEALQEIRKILFKIDFSSYQPIHPTMAIYPQGHASFSDVQNNLIHWFLTGHEQ